MARTLAREVEACGSAVVVTEAHPLPDGFLEGADLACVIGGDGTLLGIVPQAVRFDVPILGVNVGKLGFLVTYPPTGIEALVNEILRGNYRIKQRAVIECRIGEHPPHIGLNDVVIREQRSRLITLSVQASDQLVNAYDCDGLIFCTATGSTAYNLSAGGPILDPALDAIVMTPICPHALSNRSVIFPSKALLRVACRSPEACPQVSIDGRTVDFRAPDGDVQLRLIPDCVRLIHAPGYSHFATIRTKLNWTESNRSASLS